MLQSRGLQSVGHDLETEQQQQPEEGNAGTGKPRKNQVRWRLAPSRQQREPVQSLEGAMERRQIQEAGISGGGKGHELGSEGRQEIVSYVMGSR